MDYACFKSDIGNTPSQGGFHHPPGQGGQSNSPPMVIGRPQIPVSSRLFEPRLKSTRRAP